MERVVTAELDHPDTTVFPVLADLGTYESWLSLVQRVEPASGDPADQGPAWLVTLRAKIGPVARSKRLRMVRTAHEPSRHVRFERFELDGRRHSAWTMDATVIDGAQGAGSTVARVELRYDGGLWSSALDLLLGSSVDDAVEGLRRQVAAAH